MGNVYKVVDNRTGVAKKFHALTQALDNYPKEVFRGLAEVIVDSSPVDTGTYMDNHHISDIGKRQYARGVESSHDKPRRQPKGPYAAAAYARLGSEIEALPEDGRWAYFYNTSVHADMVEGKYAPYGVVRSEFRRLVETSWRSVSGNK